MLDRVLSDPALVYNILITRLWYKLSVYKTQREVHFLPFTSHCLLQNFYGLTGVISPLFFTIFKILHIVMIGGGGGYVVKTYPSICIHESVAMTLRSLRSIFRPV